MQCLFLSTAGLVKLLEDVPDFSVDRNQYLSTGGSQWGSGYSLYNNSCSRSTAASLK